LIEGRYRHTSCHFNSQFIYIFSGRSSENHRGLESIERLEFKPDDSDKKWTNVTPENNIPSPRIWAGAG